MVLRRSEPVFLRKCSNVLLVTIVTIGYLSLVAMHWLLVARMAIL